jgi:hypothetical protein
MTDQMERAAQVARKIKELQAQADEIAEAIKNLKAKEVEIFHDEGDYIVGDNEGGFLQVTVYQHKTFNEAYGKKQRPDLWEKAKITQEVVTSTSAKLYLDEDEYAVFQKPSADLSVKINVIDND